MGVYDRDYYRDGEGGWLGGLPRRATVWLVVGTAVVWLGELFSHNPARGGEGGLFAALSLTPDAIAGGQVWRLLTAPFAHRSGALLAVLVGLYTLYVFGSAVEEVLGSREYLALVAAVTVLSSLAQIGLWAAEPDRPGRAAGGLGVVLVAVVIWYACQFPDARILLFFVLPVPAWVVGVGIALLAAFGSAKSGFESGPAAVLVAAGLAFAHHRLRPRLTDWLPAGRGGGRRLRVFRDDPPADDDAPTPPAAARPNRADEQFEAQIDRILEKVSASGRSSLSADEQQTLLRASEVYRRRRGT